MYGGINLLNRISNYVMSNMTQNIYTMSNMNQMNISNHSMNKEDTSKNIFKEGIICGKSKCGKNEEKNNEFCK